MTSPDCQYHNITWNYFLTIVDHILLVASWHWQCWQCGIQHWPWWGDERLHTQCWSYVSCNFTGTVLLCVLTLSSHLRVVASGWWRVVLPDWPGHISHTACHLPALSPPTTVRLWLRLRWLEHTRHGDCYMCFICFLVTSFCKPLFLKSSFKLNLHYLKENL